MAFQLIIKVSFLLYVCACNSENKRIVYHSDSDMLHVVSALQREMAELRNKTTGYENKLAVLESNNRDSLGKIRTLETELTELKAKSSRIGVTYVRWGRTTCPSNGTEIIYKGRMAGGDYAESGNGANSLCLPDDPTWSKYVDGHNNGAKIYGTEIEVGQISVSNALFGKNVIDEDIPCVVCKSSRSSHVMVPARANCYPGWTEEYSGYIVAAYPSQSKVDYVCLDAGLEFAPHGAANDNDHLVRPVEVQCGGHGSIPCPPYVDGRELACVVCTK